MNRVAIFFLALVVSACIAQKCSVDKDCTPGFKCSAGSCAVNPACPMRNPNVPEGCKLDLSVDEKNCPKHKVVC
ncbi:hypothetical protein RB195_005441 [Necator americanus]|uniref:WAP domain-containing protein n=1 Tax=Necator americanus TaxID=51031 RepID=A0ABR1BRW2_NECAM